MKQKSIEEAVQKFKELFGCVVKTNWYETTPYSIGEAKVSSDPEEYLSAYVADTLTKDRQHLIQTIRKEVEGMGGKWKAIYYPASDERRLPLEEKLFETEKEAWEAVEKHTKGCSIAGREGWVKGKPCESCLAEWGVHKNEEISFEDILTLLTTLEEEVSDY